jgi:hypothetical protein
LTGRTAAVSLDAKVAKTTAAGTDISVEELQLAARNHALPLEAPLSHEWNYDGFCNAVQRVRVTLE